MDKLIGDERVQNQQDIMYLQDETNVFAGFPIASFVGPIDTALLLEIFDSSGYYECERETRKQAAARIDLDSDRVFRH